MQKTKFTSIVFMYINSEMYVQKIMQNSVRFQYMYLYIPYINCVACMIIHFELGMFFCNAYKQICILTLAAGPSFKKTSEILNLVFRICGLLQRENFILISWHEFSINTVQLCMYCMKFLKIKYFPFPFHILKWQKSFLVCNSNLNA